MPEVIPVAAGNKKTAATTPTTPAPAASNEDFAKVSTYLLTLILITCIAEHLSSQR